MPAQPSSAQICADLHNAIIRQLPGPVRGIRRNYISILQAQQPALYSTLEGSQFLEFLSLIDNYDGTNNRAYLTPKVLKPEPAWFLSYREFDVGDHYPEHILLYPDAESGNNGGIIYDLATDLATWAFFPHWPRADEWGPLADILSKWLESWEVGRFYFDEETQGLATRPWVPRDVEEALKSWTALTNTIAARLPPDNEHAMDSPVQSLEPILQQSQLESANFHPFATAFLSRAALPLPRIKFIAPSTTMWTPTSFRADIEGEPSSSQRRRYVSRRGFTVEESPALLFPALRSLEGPAIRVPLPAPAEMQSVIRGFEQDWGFGKFTLDRRAGVYLYPDPLVGAGDAVVVLEESGLCDWGERRGRCTWGQGHNGVKLAEMLDKWRELIEGGVWQIGEFGVVGDWR